MYCISLTREQETQTLSISTENYLMDLVTNKENVSCTALEFEIKSKTIVLKIWTKTTLSYFKGIARKTVLT